MKMNIELVGPQDAQKILAKTIENRPIRRGWVMALADQMRRGQWQSTHQGIAIDKDGYLIDGQHRMLAVIESGETIGIMVSRGCDKSTYRNIDSGLARTVGDRLKLLSDPRANQIACSAVRSYIIATQKPRFRVPVDMVDNVFLTMADEFAFVANKFTSPVPGVTRSDVAAACACYMSKHHAEADGFIEGLLLGEGMKRGEPAMAMREALLQRRAGKQGHEVYWKTIWATQKHHAGEDIRGIYPATKDWRGNVYDRLSLELTNRGIKGSETRKREEILGKKAVETLQVVKDTARTTPAAHTRR